jgi:hypothetical protein
MPASFTVARSLDIRAPAESLHPHIADFHAWSLSKVKVDLRFMKPFVAHNTAEFTLESRGQNTAVTWAMYGPLTFMSRVMGLFINMDRMIGTGFEAGLWNLETIAGK